MNHVAGFHKRNEGRVFTEQDFMDSRGNVINPNHEQNAGHLRNRFGQYYGFKKGDVRIPRMRDHVDSNEDITEEDDNSPNGPAPIKVNE